MELNERYDDNANRRCVARMASGERNARDCRLRCGAFSLALASGARFPL